MGGWEAEWVCRHRFAVVGVRDDGSERKRRVDVGRVLVVGLG